jgi:hypothetical protein
MIMIMMIMMLIIIIIISCCCCCFILVLLLYSELIFKECVLILDDGLAYHKVPTFTGQSNKNDIQPELIKPTFVFRIFKVLQILCC